MPFTMLRPVRFLMVMSAEFDYGKNVEQQRTLAGKADAGEVARYSRLHICFTGNAAK